MGGPGFEPRLGRSFLSNISSQPPKGIPMRLIFMTHSVVVWKFSNYLVSEFRMQCASLSAAIAIAK